MAGEENRQVCQQTGETSVTVEKRMDPDERNMGADIGRQRGLGIRLRIEKSGKILQPVFHQSRRLVGGGIGTAPLYLLARRLKERGVSPTVILGFNTASEIIYEKEFKALGLRTLVTTVDGSYGTPGFVTDALPLLASGYDYCYACGPMPMLRALAPKLASTAQFSLEERMGCGTGICMGCTCPQLTGTKRICKDGPVFRLDEISF